MKFFDWEERIDGIILGLRQAKQYYKTDDFELGFDKLTQTSVLLDILQNDANEY